MGKEIETLKENHDVYVLSFLSQPLDRKLYDKLQGDEHYQAVSINKLTRAWHTLIEPWMPYYFAARTSLRFSFKLIHMVRKYHIDAIHAEYAAMGQYLWIRRLFPHLEFNLIEHDMTAQSFERKLEHSSGLLHKYMKRQLRLIVKKENSYIREADHVLTFNDKDKRLIEERYGRSDVQVLNPYFGELSDLTTVQAANTVNTTAERGVADAEDTANETGKACINREKGNICFLGQMGRPENHQAAMRLIRIVKEVRKHIPYVQLYVVGNGPSDILKRQENDFIHITGFVDDVDVYLKRAQLAVFPLEQGAGIKVKVLRAMAIGIPVITGDIGAEGIDEDYQVLIHAETDQEYAEQIKRCLSEEVDITFKGRESIAYIAEHFNWQKSVEVLQKLYQ